MAVTTQNGTYERGSASAEAITNNMRNTRWLPHVDCVERIDCSAIPVGLSLRALITGVAPQRMRSHASSRITRTSERPETRLIRRQRTLDRCALVAELPTTARWTIVYRFTLD